MPFTDMARAEFRVIYMTAMNLTNIKKYTEVL